MLGGPARRRDPSDRAPFVPVIAGGHHQIGEETRIGQLLSLGRSGELSEQGPNGRQPHQPASGIDSGGLLGS